jgi:glycosyltransferase involved in cell wall biosynthesis
MKIGIDGCVFVNRLTGIGNYSYHLLHALAEAMPEHEFVVLTNREPSIILSVANIRVRVSSSRFWKHNYLWKLQGLAIEAAREKVDILWAANGTGPVWTGIPVLLTVYDFVYRVEPATMSWPSRLYRSFSQPYWISHAWRVFAISAAVAREMADCCGRNADAVILPAADDSFVPVSAEAIAAVRAKYGLGERYNLLVGTLEPRKNLREFVEEYGEFGRASGAAPPPLAVIGGKGWGDREIEAVLEAGESAGLVRRLGYVPTGDLPALYSGASLFFMPSRYEGFGMPILEARKCGCPVVCSDVEAMREAGGAGALYHPPTREGIRWALEQVYVHGKTPETDRGAGADWSWESGAARLRALLVEG